MIENYYRTGNYRLDYATTYSGKIKKSDFGYTTISDIATRILQDMQFDEKCRNNIKERNEKLCIN